MRCDYTAILAHRNAEGVVRIVTGLTVISLMLAIATSQPAAQTGKGLRVLISVDMEMVEAEAIGTFITTYRPDMTP